LIGLLLTLREIFTNPYTEVMHMNRTNGIVLLIGSLLFLVAAFMPVSQVFAVRGAARKLAVIAADRSGWLVSQCFFVLGATVAFIGMGMLAYRLKATKGSTFPLIAVAAAGIGLVLWMMYVYLRTISPEDFVYNRIPRWLFPTYSYLTLLAIFVIGLESCRFNFPRWLSFFNMGSAVLFALAFLIFKDLPPLLYYIVTLVDGIALLVLRPFV
jgi:hypothetical protein